MGGREEREMIVKIEKEFKDDTVYLESKQYKKIFGTTFENQNRRPWKRGIVKISCNGNSVRRLFSSEGYAGISENKSRMKENEIGLSSVTASILKVEKEKEADVKLKKGSKFIFYWDHPEHYQRVTFKLALLSLLFSIISLIK
ncbi:MAG TPA: hypothetical protein PLD55_02025 [bacterium]|nr:hypothetical protein [bacterium]HOG44398.1 hypothetical protein [bacterium]HPV21242.1 hypothetical protein [bacterium]HQM83438.1 hypothetical protein [bacterium]